MATPPISRWPARLSRWSRSHRHVLWGWANRDIRSGAGFLPALEPPPPYAHSRLGLERILADRDETPPGVRAPRAMLWEWPRIARRHGAPPRVGSRALA